VPPVKKLWLILGCAALAGLSLPCLAGEFSKEPVKNLSPVLLDTRDGEGTTIGLEFEFSGERKWTKSNEDPNATTFTDPDKLTYSGFALTYKVSGTAAADEDRNPQNFINASADGQYKYSAPWGTTYAGGFLRYETDQSFENEQFVYGLTVTYGKLGIVGDLDFFGLDLRRGQVDPSEDKARQTVLGSTPLDKYYRNDLEILYIYPIKETVPFLGKMATSFEFNYRFYQESGAPAAIENARLDEFFLRTFRLNLEHELFIAYSNGKLPFDVKEDDFFTLGFSYNIN
jgi:hypothetical protein